MLTSSQLCRSIVYGLLLALLGGCAATAPEIPTSTPTSEPISLTETPGPISCDEVEGNCMKLSFDGENCTYDGPSNFASGPATLLFLNESGSLAAVNLVRHTGDETIQDMIDTIGEEPSSGHAPPWTVGLGTWEAIRSGRIFTWEGEMKPGVHTMVCASLRNGIWFGGGFTVED